MSKYFDNKGPFQTPIVTQHGSHLVMTQGGVGESGDRTLYVNFDTRFSEDLVGGGGSGAGGSGGSWSGGGGSWTESSCVTGDVANYNFVLPLRLTNIRSMSVTNVEVPMSWYTISAAWGNSTFRVTNVVTGNVFLVTVPDGNYDKSGLVAAVNGGGLPSGLTFSVNSNGHSVFTNTDISGAGYYVEFYTDSLGKNDDKYPKFKLGWLMGFRYVAYPVAFGKSLVSECILNLNGPRYLYLVVDEFQNGKENSFNAALGESGVLKKNILARVTPSYGDFPHGSVLPANLANGLLTSDCRTYGVGRSVDIQRLNVQLVNEIGQVVRLNGGHIMFCLVLTTETKS